MLYMTKQLLLLRLDNIRDEIRQYESGMKGMCEIPRDSPLVKMDADNLREMYARRDKVRAEIEEIDTLIDTRKKQFSHQFGSAEEELSFYMGIFAIPEKYRDDAKRCVENMTKYDVSAGEAFAHLVEQVVDEEEDE